MESLTVQCACQVILLCPISFVLILQYRNMAFYSLLHPSTFYYILLHPATYYNIPHVLLCPPTTSYVFDLLPHHTTTIPYLVLLHPTVLLLCPTTTLYYAILHPTFKVPLPMSHGSDRGRLKIYFGLNCSFLSNL